MKRWLLLGLGNPFRHDDGVGLYVAQRSRDAKLENCDVKLLRGDATQILEAWDGYDEALIVDSAYSHKHPVGKILRFELNESLIVNESQQTSSHGLGLVQAIDLGKSLDRIPQKLVVYSIVGRDFSMGEGLCPPVVDAAQRLLNQIIAAIKTSQDSF